MSLVPFSRQSHPFFRSAWWDVDLPSPSRIFDQHFGLGLRDDDLFPPQLFQGLYLRPRRALSRSASGMSEVSNDKDSFRVSLETGHFKPEELSVTTVDGTVVVRGKHEERSDDHGFISREFVRKFVLPPGTKPEDVTSELTSDGVLKVVAPKKTLPAPKYAERVVPIQKKEAPAVTDKPAEK